MIEDYGMGGWEYALKIKPPWTLVNAVKCMLVHWIANFSYVFSRRGQTHLESLKPLVESHKYARSDSRKRLEERIIDTCISLFNFLHKDFEEADTIVECRRILLVRPYFFVCIYLLHLQLNYYVYVNIFRLILGTLFTGREQLI